MNVVTGYDQQFRRLAETRSRRLADVNMWTVKSW